MKSIKMASLFLTFFQLSINTSFAQAPATDLNEDQQERLAKSIDVFFEVLDLSVEQKRSFEAITKKYAEEMVAVRDGKGGRISKYNTVQSIRSRKNTEMKELLSKDQYVIYLEKQKAMQKKMRENRS